MHFDAEPFESFDQLALLVRQDYNLGGAGDWFGAFRGGLYGFYARLYGVQRPIPKSTHGCHVSEPSGNGDHLASILFQMDSALECLTFAFNALGWVAMPSGFWDVTDVRTLGALAPSISSEIQRELRPLSKAWLYNNIPVPAIVLAEPRAVDQPNP